ncbi:unnamed protein product [Euphydryas editha]|uniref:DUF4817 domain-containing protein n=1 Tax=Euphydryas editha TaxID=104508 RepID=A0AAU9U313_EUPED|nr:unnamed protein product [Euphydryas editha]
MSVCTTQEYANMHLIYGECRCNASTAARLYRERYLSCSSSGSLGFFKCATFTLLRGLTPKPSAWCGETFPPLRGRCIRLDRRRPEYFSAYNRIKNWNAQKCSSQDIAKK